MGNPAPTIERESAWATEPGAFRRLAPLFLAGGLAGMLAGGLGGRIAMRISALAAPDFVRGVQTEAGGTIGRITLGGTLEAMGFAAVASALIGTAFYLGVRAWLPARRWPRALAFGALELVVFGPEIMDRRNPDFVIVRHPLLNVVLFGALFVLHGVLLVVLQRPGRRLVEAVGGGVRWRESLVDVATAAAAALTSFGIVVVILIVGVRPQGGAWWNRAWMLSLFVCAAGLAFIEPSRARRLTRPALRAMGGLALAVIALSGGIALLDAVTTIV